MESPFIHQLREQATAWDRRFDQEHNDQCKVVAVGLRSLADQLLTNHTHIAPQVAQAFSEVINASEVSVVAEAVNALSKILTKPPKEESIMSHFPVAQYTVQHSASGGGGNPPDIDKFLKKTQTNLFKEHEEEQREWKKLFYSCDFAPRAKMIDTKFMEDFISQVHVKSKIVPPDFDADITQLLFTPIAFNGLIQPINDRDYDYLDGVNDLFQEQNNTQTLAARILGWLTFSR